MAARSAAVILCGVFSRALLAGLVLASTLPLRAQFEGFGREQLLKYTAQNPYERFTDGRPQVPDYWLKRLESASTTIATDVLREEGYPNQWEDGWAILHPEKKLIGRAFTVQFMPSRPDLEGMLEKDAAEAANEEEIPTPVTQRVMEMFGPGDVPVVDVMGRIEEGTFGGDNLIFSMFMATGNGFVVDDRFATSTACTRCRRWSSAADITRACGAAQS